MTEQETIEVLKENNIKEDMKTLEEIIKANEDCINAIYSQMKVKNDDNEDIQYFKKEIQSIRNIVNNYLKEKSRADKLEKEYKHYKQFESISIQKVKGKIEEHKNMCISNVNSYENYFKDNYNELVFRRMEQLEKELLEKE